MLSPEALASLRKEQWFLKLKNRLDQFDESEDHGETTWGKQAAIQVEPVPSSKKKTTSKKVENQTIKEAKNEDKEENDEEDDDYADDDFTMGDAYGEEDEEEDDDDGGAGFKSPTQGQTISKEDSKKYPYMNLVLELLTQLK